MHMVLIFDLLLFIAVSSIHLYRRRYHGREIVGNISKLFLIPSLYLLIFLFFSSSPHSLNKPWLVASIALSYALGDLFLLFKRRTFFFYLGAVSFSLGHLMYILYFSSFGLSIGFALIGFFFSLMFLLRYLKKIHSKVPGKELPYLLYAVGIVGLALSSFGLFKVDPLAALFACFGSVLFGLSDSFIAYNKAGVKRTSSFAIMLSYIFANILLVLSIIMLNMC